MKAATLAVKQNARNEKMQAQLDEWFAKFDTNGDQQFNRTELAALLAHLNPGAPPTDEVIDTVMRDATGVYGPSVRKSAASSVYDAADRKMVLAGDVNGLVHRDKLIPTVKKYSAYVKEQAKIDSIFAKFDQDDSGLLVSALVPAPRRSPSCPASMLSSARARVRRSVRSCCP